MFLTLRFLRSGPGAVVLLACALVCLRSGRASAQNGADGTGGRHGDVAYPIDVEAAPRPSLRALRIDEAIVLDGVLDEPAWQRADSATDFITTLPRDGYPASERSVARVLFDGARLYVGAYLYDAEPERLHSPGLDQDFETHDADLFGVAFDTFLDRQNGIMFAVSPAGALYDSQVFNDSREINRAWEGVVEVKTSIHDDGWSVEFAIPLRTLRFRAGDGEQSWGINFLRRIRRINEDSYWAPLARQFRLHKMSRAGTLTGLSQLRTGRNLTVKPYISASNAGGEARLAEDRGSNIDAGFDLKYGVTSRLTLDVTAFTDFSQVEVDQEQVNLTRFSLFFPEKRDFFLENEGIFTLGDVSERSLRTGSGPHDFKLFYSRAIGLSADRRVIPILGGARLSGRIGSAEIGVLNMQTRNSAIAPAENFGVLRLRQNIGTSGDVGVMFVNRQGTSEGVTGRYNRSFGADANFHLFRYLLLNTYVAGTSESDGRGDASAAYFQAAWRDALWDASAFVKRVGAGFDPGVGFIRRRAIRQGFVTVGAHPQPGIPKLAELNPYIDLSAIRNLDGALETQIVKPGIIATFVDGGMFSLDREDRFERLFEETPIAGAVVAPGAYRFATLAAKYTSNGARRLSGSVGGTIGDFYDGDRASLSASVQFRPSYHLSLEGFAEHNALTLGGRSFSADVFGGRLDYAASTRFFASAFVQYIESADELVSNIRFNYIHAPLSDVFLVLTERRGVDSGTVAERLVTLKVTKLLAF